MFHTAKRLGTERSESEPVEMGSVFSSVGGGPSTIVRQSQACSQWQMVLEKLGSKIIIYPFRLWFSDSEMEADHGSFPL